MSIIVSKTKVSELTIDELKEIINDFVEVKVKELFQNNQTWFWTEQWRKGEDDANIAIENKMYKDYDIVDELIEDIK